MSAEGFSERASSHRRTWEAIVVSALGSTSIREAVTTMSSVARWWAATMRIAARSSASERSWRRVVPAWSARPWRSACTRIRAASAAHDREALEVGCLVDVQLEEAAQAPEPRRRPRDAGGIDAGGGHRVGQAHAVVVARARGRRDRATPASARLPKVGVLKRAPSSSAKAMTATGACSATREGGAHAQRAVVAPAGAHAVEVRADAPPRLRRVGQRPAVAGGVDLDAQADLGRAAREPRARGRVLGRPGQPRGAALVEADGLEVGQAPREVVRRDHDAILHAASGRTHATSPARMTRHTGLRPKR